VGQARAARDAARDPADAASPARLAGASG